MKRLELGLIQVFSGSQPSVQVVDHPRPYPRRQNHARKRELLAEARARSGDYNLGGSTGRKLVTAYRERAIRIAVILQKRGALSPKDLQILGTVAKTQPMLYHNVYGWFHRLGGGLYRISDQGRSEIKDYPELVKNFQRSLGGKVTTKTRERITRNSKNGRQK